MTRSLIAISAGLLLTFCLTGCGAGDPELPDGHTEDEILTPPDNPTGTTPGGGIPKPEKGGTGG